MSDAPTVLRELAQDYISRADQFRGSPPNSPGETTVLVYLEVAQELQEKATEILEADMSRRPEGDEW